MSGPATSPSFRCRLEWGRRGASAAADRGDILVVVDTLSFSSAVVTAIHHGAVILPCAPDADLAALCARHAAEAAVPRRDVPAAGRFSLSPLTYRNIAPGTTVILASPNGAMCSAYGRQAPHLFVGTLNNARAVAAAVSRLLDTTTLGVTVLACGERWRDASDDGPLRFAVEDYLGAGAILSSLTARRSPEAGVCAAAFAGVRDDLPRIIDECVSGQELRAIGFAGDNAHAAALDLYDSVPVMRGERLESA